MGLVWKDFGALWRILHDMNDKYFVNLRVVSWREASNLIKSAGLICICKTH